MSKYHVNQETGRAGQCKAAKKGCPLGTDTPHFETKEEANAYIEAAEASKNNIFNKVRKNLQVVVKTMGRLIKILK